jgi:hypothetical protein
LISEKYSWSVAACDAVMNFHKNFFRALLTPPTLETGLVSSEPATSILLIPGIMNLRVRLVGFNWTVHQRDPEGRAMRQTFDLQFVEAQSRRWDASEIMERGYFRT